MSVSLRRAQRGARNPVPWMYRRLLRCFGPQGWWPVTPAGKKHPIYARRFTRRGLTPAQQFEMAAGAVLTQNTSWSNVRKAMIGLSAAGLLSPRRLARVPLPRLYRLLRSSGYFRQKSRRLRDFARFLVRRWEGDLDAFLDRPTALVREELLALKGIGPETADSILLYAGRHPVFVVDAYTRRLGRRFGLFRTEDYHAVQDYFSSRLPASLPAYRECHALIVALAKQHCRAAPACGGCPVRPRCARRLPRAA